MNKKIIITLVTFVILAIIGFTNFGPVPDVDENALFDKALENLAKTDSRSQNFDLEIEIEFPENEDSEDSETAGLKSVSIDVRSQGHDVVREDDVYGESDLNIVVGFEGSEGGRISKAIDLDLDIKALDGKALARIDNIKTNLDHLNLLGEGSSVDDTILTIVEQFAGDTWIDLSQGDDSDIAQIGFATLEDNVAALAKIGEEVVTIQSVDKSRKEFTYNVKIDFAKLFGALRDYYESDVAISLIGKESAAMSSARFAEIAAQIDSDPEFRAVYDQISEDLEVEIEVGIQSERVEGVEISYEGNYKDIEISAELDIDYSDFGKDFPKPENEENVVPLMEILYSFIGFNPATQMPTGVPPTIPAGLPAGTEFDPSMMEIPEMPDVPTQY